MLSRRVRGIPARVYVPDSDADTVDVIDPRRMRVMGRVPVGRLPQHVTPAHDLKRLWVDNDQGNSLTPITPRSGRPGAARRGDRSVQPVLHAARRSRDRGGREVAAAGFRSPRSMRLRRSLSVPCPGVDHMDFTADGRFLLASCEFGARMIRVDVESRRLTGVLRLPAGSQPQGVKLAADGRTFYVADKGRGGVYRVGARPLRVMGFVPTGAGAHGLYVSRDGRRLYVTNRAPGPCPCSRGRDAR